MNDDGRLSKRRTKGRGRIYDSIIDTIGDTPLVRLSRLAADAGVEAEILGREARALLPPGWGTAALCTCRSSSSSPSSTQ